MKSIFLHKIKKLAIRLPELAIILCFLSCHNPVAITEAKSADKSYLAIEIGGQGRTVLPNSIDIFDMTISIAFEGTKNGSEEKIEYRWNPTATEPAYMQMRVDSSICIGTGTWNFTLKILQNENLILIGSINGKDVQNGTNTLNFVLYPANISGSGDIAVTLQFPSKGGVEKADARLYTLEGNEVAGSEINFVIDNGTSGISQVSYVKTDIASGTYLMQFNLYNNNDDLMNTYMEAVTVASGYISSAERSLSSLNTLYTITYHNITGATWAKDFTAPASYNTDMSVTLPAKKNIELGDCTFLGWYENADFSGEPVSGWSPGRTGDAEFYAGWGVETTADNVSNVINGLSDSVVYTVVLTGAVDNGTINKIRNALQDNSGVKIYLDLSLMTELKEIPDRGFWYCSNLLGIVLPDSVTMIGDNAFRNCTSLTGITLPNSLTTISDNAFRNCTSLTGITLPNSLTTIGKYAFAGCRALTDITIPGSVKTIGYAAFEKCLALTNVTISDGVETIGDYAFSLCIALTDITIPGSVETIGFGAFENCSLLINVTISDGVERISDYAFKGCTALTYITIPESVTMIGSYAFAECTALTSITIPNRVTRIETGMFAGCTALINVTIPNSVTRIDMSAFRGCASLASITIPKNVTKIGAYAFSECTNLKNVTFSDPSGWGPGGNNLEGLSDSETAARYLTATYLGSDWNKE